MKQLVEKFINIEKVYERLKDFVNPNKISPFMEIATTASAIISQDDNVYFGINIKGDCGLGFCAERNAISSMLCMGETKIKYILCIDRSFSFRLPCGACREFIVQINPQNMDCQIIKNINPLKLMTLKELIPEWWGYEKLSKSLENKK